MAETINLALVKIVKHLEAARSEAEAGGKDLALLAYMIDMALVEAGERQKQ